jgi:DNA-binding transcriptional LysR family regulator
MNKLADWTLIRFFLAVAEGGSLSAAARATGTSQPTIGRHIAALQAALGVSLFTRTINGMQLTDAGLDLLPAATEMRDAALRLGFAAEGRTEVAGGTVRITASRVVSQTLLPGIVADMRRVDPSIAIELVPSDSSENLLYREADIALRMYRPTQLDVITRLVAMVPLGLYATTAYLDAAGRPESFADLSRVDLIGYDRSEILLRGLREIGVPLARDDFALRSDDHMVCWELVRAGCGVGVVQVRLAATDPAVERVLPHLPLPSLPIWLTAPEALRSSPRIRRVWDRLAAALHALSPP